MTSTNEKDEAELRRLAEAKCAEAAKLEAEAEKPRAAPHRETFYDLSGNEPVPMRYDADLANAQRQIEREQLLRRALEEYSESSRLFRRADDRCSLASVEENIGRLYFKLKDLKRARARLKLAEKLHEKNGDRIAAARVRVTRADVFTEQGDYVKALRLARDAAGRLQQHHPGETARALITSARALARQGNIGRAESALRLAYKTAIESGDAERAADAGLVMIEEIHALMNAAELLDCFDKTNKLLQSPQNIATLNRLNECANIAIGKAVSDANTPDSRIKFITLDGSGSINLSEEVKRYEALLIRSAMELTGNSVVRASRLLRLNNYQTLIAMLGKGGRHEGLIPDYVPKPQRKSYTTGQRKKNRRARH